MDFSAVCRTCLSGSDLNPIFAIFQDPEAEMQYSAEIYVAAGVKVKPNDGLPQQMCSTCTNTLNKHLEFRKQCKHVQTQLLKYRNKDSNMSKHNSIYVETLQTQIDDNPVLTEEMVSEYLDEYVLDENPFSEFTVKEEDNFDEEFVINEEYLEIETSDSSEAVVEETINYYYILASGRAKCRLCSKVLAANGMDLHMARKHPQVDSSIIKCHQCDRYLKKTGLAKHKQKAHRGTKRAHSDEEFQNGDSVLKRRGRSQNSELMSECDVCHKRMLKASLRLHKAIKHAGLKPVCEHCGRSFGSTYRLKEHYRSKHGYDKIKCKQCPFESSSAIAMQNHERRHLGEKPFVCECGAKFHAAYLLAQHRQIHRDTIYKCDQCLKTFKVNNSLHLHKATCHSTTQVKCHMCDRTYSNRHYAVKHMRQFHGYFGTVPVLEKFDITENIGGEKKIVIEELNSTPKLLNSDQ